MYVTRGEFRALIVGSAVVCTELDQESRDALRKVADESTACAVGAFGTPFDMWPCPDEPLLDCMCPATQAGLRPGDDGVGDFACAFDNAVSNLADRNDVPMYQTTNLQVTE